jgi:lipid-A-disaccharide synthase
LEKILISAGEESGDLYASLLVKEIKKQRKNIKIIGFGGPQLEKAGADLKINLLQIAIIGFWEVVLNFFKIISVILKAEKVLKKEKPDGLVVIDFPGFHLWLIKKAKQLGVKKIIYWITPQIWAWKYDRIKTIKKYCDLCIVVFPFEEDIFRKEKIPVRYFGHPLMEIIKNIKVSKQENNIGIFPGSREEEIKNFLPIILKSCVLLKENIPEARFLIFKSKSVKENFLNKFLSGYSELKIKIINGDDFVKRKSLSAAIVKSGTVTLENALLGIPMVVIYKISTISYLVIRKLLTIKFISLPNIIADRKIVPELTQNNFTSDKIYKEIMKIFRDKRYINYVKNEYKKIYKKLYLKIP